MAGQPLTDARLRTLKATDKIQKISDGGGLFLYIPTSGSKLWRLAYRFDGKQKTLALGKYPDVSLAEARRRRDEAKALLARGLDPSEERKRLKTEGETSAREQALTFERVAREWFDKRTADRKPGYRKQLLSRLEKNLLPSLGARPLAELETQDFLDALRPVEERGSLEMAHKLAQMLNQICRYAKVAGYVRHNEAADIGEALEARGERKHFPTITDPAQIGILLRAIDDSTSDIPVKYALKIMPYVFVRSGELRGARWEEIDFEKAEWRIPKGRMKKNRAHVVPLAPQVLKLFEEIRQWTGGGEFVFYSSQAEAQKITDMGLLKGLRLLGYGQNEMCIHGFRAMASTLLNEMNFRPDVIEAQLAHSEKNAVREAYNHAQYMEERRAMMVAWADYLDTLREQSGGASGSLAKP